MTRAAPARRVRDRGTVESRHDADALLERPGDVVLVERGRPRSLVFSCPDGCGSVLTINLDPRAGKAWRLYKRGEAMSLYPSVWRDNGCRAHFVLWHDRLLWCGPGDQGGDEPPYAAEIEALVLSALTVEYQTANAIAERLGEIPWEITRIADRLVKAGKAEARNVTGTKYYRKMEARLLSHRELHAPEPEVGSQRRPAQGFSRWFRFRSWWRF